MTFVFHVLPPMPTARSAKPGSKKTCPRKGYSTKRRTHGETLLTDAQVIECRGRHEFQGWTSRRCAEHYGTTADYMQSLLGYQTRSKLFPKPEDFGRSA